MSHIHLSFFQTQTQVLQRDTLNIQNMSQTLPNMHEQVTYQKANNSSIFILPWYDALLQKVTGFNKKKARICLQKVSTTTHFGLSVFRTHLQQILAQVTIYHLAPRHDKNLQGKHHLLAAGAATSPAKTNTCHQMSPFKKEGHDSKGRRIVHVPVPIFFRGPSDSLVFVIAPPQRYSTPQQKLRPYDQGLLDHHSFPLNKAGCFSTLISWGGYEKGVLGGSSHLISG